MVGRLGIWVVGWLLSGCLLLPLDEVAETADTDAAAPSGRDGGDRDPGRDSAVNRDGAAGDPCAEACRAGDERCVRGEAQTCRLDEDGCYAFQTTGSCMDDCAMGECCTDDCVAATTRCRDAEQERCGDHDDDPCLDWGDPTPCLTGCDGDTCAAPMTACAQEAEPCRTDTDCCGGADESDRCIGGLCRRACTFDEDCGVCCLPLYSSADNSYLGRGCGYSVEECNAVAGTILSPFPCGGGPQCLTEQCGDGGFCALECGPELPYLGSTVCYIGLTGVPNPCIANVEGVFGCFPGCTTDQDCIPYPNTTCQDAVNFEGYTVRACGL